jgi:hypothetical protein
MTTLQEARDAKRRAWRVLQKCPAAERTFRAQQLAQARKALRVAESRAALEVREPTEVERRLAALEQRQRGRAA